MRFRVWIAQNGLSKQKQYMLSSRANNFPTSIKPESREVAPRSMTSWLGEKRSFDIMSSWDTYAPILTFESLWKVLNESSRERNREDEGRRCRIASTRIAVLSTKSPQNCVLCPLLIAPLKVGVAARAVAGARGSPARPDRRLFVTRHVNGAS